MERFKYHFEPKDGWMNDPNGLIHYKGLYHFFYQHYPYDTKWGPMHWGHVTSENLIDFTEHEIALCPDKDYENDGGCFSGSAIEKDGRLYLFYTSVSKEYGQAQSVAVSEDGYHFEKYEGNPVIKSYPAMDATADFRDPKVFEFDGEYRMIVGTRYNDKGRVLAYKSDNLFDWSYQGVLYESKEYSNVIECPDLFKLGDAWVLMYSKIGQNEYATQFITGEYDGVSFAPKEYSTMEAGPQFYAPQTFEDNRGRRIMVGWFYDWKRSLDEGATSAGALALPRELKLVEGKLVARPVEEAKNIIRQVNSVRGEGVKLEGLEMDINDDSLTLCNGKESVTYHGTIDKIEVLEDVKAVEIFINGGEKNISMWR